MPSRGELFLLVGAGLLIYGCIALDSFSQSFRDLIRGEPQDRALLLIAAGLIGIGWGAYRLRSARPRK